MALHARSQPCVTARTRDAEMLHRLRSSMRWVPAGGSPIVPLSPATPNCSPGLSGPAVRHESPLCHVFPRSRSFVMACLPRATATLARQVPPCRRARGARTSIPRGLTRRGGGGVLLREGATRLSGITARHHWSRGDAGGGVRGWRVTARDLEVRGTRRLPQRTQGLGVSRSPRRPPLGDSRMEIILGCSWSPPGTQELRMSPPGNSGVILGIFTEDTGD